VLRAGCRSAMPASMIADSDAIDQINSLDADDRALAIHEAGHAVVARALGAEVVFVEIYISSPSPDDGKKGGGKTGLREEMTDNIKNLAVSVVGRKAEHAFAALALRSTRTEERSRHDLQEMENLLLRFPEAERCAARAASPRFGDITPLTSRLKCSSAE
jgi:hypothetical protein